MSGASVIVRGVEKSFGNVVALAGVDLEVQPGEIVCLLGPNGAGKTTLTRVLSALTPADRGTCVVVGHDVATDPASVRAAIGFVNQSVAIDAELTTRETLMFAARLRGLARTKAEERVEILLSRLDLEPSADRRVGVLSGGTRRRIDVIASLVSEPEVLFLDEPTTGLDPVARTEVWHIVEEAREQGRSVIITTQQLDEAERLADRVCVIAAGRIVAVGPPDALRRAVGDLTLDLHLADGSSAEDVSRFLAKMGRDPAVVVDRSRVRIATGDADESAAIVAGLVTDAGLRLHSFGVHPPSLDEAFAFFTKGDGATQASIPARSDEIVGALVKDVSTRSSLGPVLHQTAEMVRRNLIKLRRTPSVALVSTLQPAVFMFLFSSVVGSVATVPGVSYQDFVLPAAIVQSLVIGAMATGIGLSLDRFTGMLERFRSLPIARSAIFLGRAGTGAIRVFLQSVVLVGVGYLFGLRFQSAGAALLALPFFAIAALAYSALSCALALRVRNLEVYQIVSFLPVLPFLFVSSAYAPLDKLPPVMQRLASVNPINLAIEVMRGMFLGGIYAEGMVGRWVGMLLWSAVFVIGSTVYGAHALERDGA